MNPPTSLLDRIVVVLDHPQNVVNIAGVMRAMLNMGLSRLRLVQPDEFDPWRIEGIAHRSGPLIEATEIVDTLEEAVADCVFVVGTTARARTANRNYVRPRPLAAEMLERAVDGPVAIVLWLPVLLPMDKQRRVALAATTAMMAVPYVQHYDYMVVWVMTADGLGLVSHLYGLFFTFVGERATKGILIIPMLGAWFLLAREPMAQAWTRARSALAARGGSVEQPA